jgi:23S rRNA (adenine2503-C2)-methyltransferase
MNFGKLKKFMKANNLPGYRVGQVKDLIYKKALSDWKDAVNLPLVLRAKLEEIIPILSFKAQKVLVSRDKKSAKAVLVLYDGTKIETVLLNPFKNHWSVCVSTQVGCSIKCFFCATGLMGFKRNLSAEEISDQVLFWFQYIKKHTAVKRISSVVFMGMGEPFLNYAQVVTAVNNLSDSDFFNIGQRNISISTCGQVDGIRKLARDLPRVNLAVSLHSADDNKRNKLVSINRIYNLAKLSKALAGYLQRTKRRVFIEYTLIDKVNDSFKDARVLCKWINAIPSSYLLTVNLISCNDFKATRYCVSRSKVEMFAQVLKSQKINVTIRRSLGGSIGAGCGQLGASGVR